MKTSMKVLISIGVVALIVGVAYMVFRVEEPVNEPEVENEEVVDNLETEGEESDTNVDSEVDGEEPDINVDSEQEKDFTSINSSEDLTALVDEIYKGLEVEMPMLATQVVDITDNDAVKYVTGLENANDLEYVVESLPMMMAQPYSLVLVKVKDGVNVEMNDNIDNRKWICVTAEKVYTTTSGNVICLVMSHEETAKAVYDNFKKIAGTIGKEYERTEEEIALPDDMLPAYDGEALAE